jgi:hypothetical protein
MKISSRVAIIVTIISFACGSIFIRAADVAPPKYTVAEIMKALFKGEDAVGKKVGKGTGTKEDYDKLVEYLSALPLNDAPQGDPVEWKKKTTALLDAATALKAGKPEALAQYNQAVNCQACHRVYRAE